MKEVLKQVSDLALEIDLKSEDYIDSEDTVLIGYELLSIAEKMQN